MSDYLEGVGAIDEERIDSLSFKEKTSELKSRELTPVETSTDQIASEIIPNIDTAMRFDALDPNRRSDVPPIAEKVDAAAASAGIKDPQLAREAIKAGLGSIELQENKIRETDDKIRESLALIQKIQVLSGKLPPINVDKNSYELPDELHLLANALKEKAIELPINGEKTFTREQIEALKSQISSVIEKYNLDVKIDFTKINTTNGMLTAILDSLKNILRQLERMSEVLCRNQTPG